MRFGRAAAVVAVAAMAGQAVGQTPGQRVTGPVAEYWMSASTESGMGAGHGGMGGPPGGGDNQPPPQHHRPSFGDMMDFEAHGENSNVMRERMGAGARAGGGVSHTLILQLGSSRRPQSGEPTAEHDPPQGLGAGAALPLVTPVQQPTHVEAEPGPPPEYHPQGRMLIFWGCGEHAGPGQPLVIDMASLGKDGGQFAALARGLNVSPMQPPSPARNATYGEWPNAQSRSSIPPDGSLQGAHTIKGDYSPQIDFTLAADQDFLPPIHVTTNQKTPSGAAALGWGAVDGSQGYLATMFGARSQAETVMWTSSAVQASAFALPDYLSDHEIARLVASHVLMPASQTSCAVPAEAVQAAGMGTFRLVAYGGEYNISYPPRPPAPQPWNIAWRVKVRYRASTGGLLGMTMPGMGGMGDGQEDPYQQLQEKQQEEQRQQEQHRRNPFNPFGGLVP